ncbi:hypothetical protein XENTR_v10017222 [Xenopus tropicalis]|uniref:Tumor necrosis factor receptor superfamily member 11B n=1 Tax=Xenopus tropicalis TaxID=8364 RepID=A0A803K7X4_XENTR|nr:tumor necrosis factor receptor superfamily member 11B [Xenopus tropicalis]KAE8599522.1 hypothetical protein XENTR_v10017222 [Xenopus tropicalis]|eukprot:XP_002938025.2 PREDICTED: tumor necrosis factor receptor superfamily member 11B [Xenopus tropicalis]
MYRIISCTLLVLLRLSITKGNEPSMPVYLQCDQCPPGMYVKQDCTTERKTECAPCPAHHYSDMWDSNTECNFCNVVCKELQYVKQECNSTHNRLCECAAGMYLDLEFCVYHKKCRPGFGVIQEGTPDSDTVCRQCPEGTFSNATSATARCQKHTDCKKLGLKVAQPGDSKRDTQCQPEGSFCEIDVTLCEEGLFQFVPSNWLTAVAQRIPSAMVSSQQIEGVQEQRDPQEQAFHMFKLWKDHNRESESGKLLFQDLQVCEKRVSKLFGRLNVTVEQLRILMRSLPVKKISKDELETTVKLCSQPDQVLKLLNLWRNKNGGNTISLLKVIKTNRLPKMLRRTIKKLEQFLSSDAMYRLYQKLLLEVFGSQTQPAKVDYK